MDSIPHRDRTPTFQLLRGIHSPLYSPAMSKAATDALESQQSLLLPDATEAMEVKIRVAPKWMAIFDEISFDLKQLGTRVELLAAEQTRHLAPEEFGSAERTKKAIVLAVAGITKQFQATKTKIRGIAAIEVESPEEEVVKRDQQVSFMSQLHDLSVLFKKTQRAYLGKLEQQSGGTLLEKYQQQHGPAQQQEQVHDLSAVDRSIMDERDAEIREIARSMETISQMFADLNDLVMAQGTYLDRIDLNIQQADINVKKSLPEIHQAYNHAKSARQCSCILWGTAAVALSIVVIVLLLKLGIAA